MNVENDGANLSILMFQAMLYVFNKILIFLAGKHDFYIQAKFIYKCLVDKLVSHIETIS